VSRIGKTPIEIPQDVNVEINGNVITVKGKKGELSYTMLSGISAQVKDNMIEIKRAEDTKNLRAFHGLTRSLVQNMVIGVSKGFEKNLQVIGTGYGAEVVGPWLKLVLGYSHDILLEIPEGIEVITETIPRREQGKLGVQAKIKVKGINKEDVGKFAAEIRRCREPENYKGKGIRYEGEYVQIKAGKAGAA
jgi:large subunit ribosomal protein L6